jgi:hypothetical protein
MRVIVIVIAQVCLDDQRAAQLRAPKSPPLSPRANDMPALPALPRESAGWAKATTRASQAQPVRALCACCVRVWLQ